jgi:hypothetical protein
LRWIVSLPALVYDIFNISVFSKNVSGVSNISIKLENHGVVSILLILAPGIELSESQNTNKS